MEAVLCNWISPVPLNICKGSNCTTAAVPLNVSQSTTPPPPPPVQLTRVSIGSYLSTSSIKPLIYNSSDTGKSWVLNTTALPVPSNIQPAFAVSNPLSLSSVTCGTTSQAQCVMVGFYRTIDDNTAPIVYTSVDSGKTWALSASLPLPSDIPPNGNQPFLFSVACDNTGLKCTTVGGYTNDLDNFFVPVSYASTDGGKTWVITTTFTLPAASSSNPNIQLQAIHCDSNGKKCTTVGTYVDPSDNTMPLAYTSSNAGTNWTLRSMPTPSDPSSRDAKTQLIGVACDNTAELSCTAVGSYNDSSDVVRVPLAYATSNGGVTWAQITVPLPSAGASVALGGVSCDHSGLICTAVGFYPPLNHLIALPPNPLSYTSTNGGQSWILSAALPVSTTGTYILRGVSCDNATGLQCSAVGTKIVSNKRLPISYISSNGGVTWTITDMTPPTDLSPGLRSSMMRQNPKGFLGLYSVH